MELDEVVQRNNFPYLEFFRPADFCALVISERQEITRTIKKK